MAFGIFRWPSSLIGDIRRSGLPRHKSSATFVEYHAEWMTRLHLHYYQGTFLSDRYFAETFVTHMNGALNGVKAHIHAQIRRVPISMPLPMLLQPENIVGFICNTVKLIGVPDLTPLTTPREYLETHSRSRRTSNPSNGRQVSTRNVRQIAPPDDEADCADIRQTDVFWDLDEEIQLRSMHSPLQHRAR